MVIESPYPKIHIPEQNVLSYLFGSGETVSDQPLWIDSADATTYLTTRTALQWIKRLGAGLDKLGVKPGEVVLAITPNHIFVPVAYLGIVGSGRTYSGANPMYTPDELSFQMKNTETRIVLVYPSLLATARKAAESAGLSEDQLYLFSDTEHASIDGIKDWRSILGSPEEGSTYRWPEFSGSASKSQIATVNYSSGTTGLPKGVMISHYNLVANVAQSLYSAYTRQGIHSPPEKWIGFLPLYHAFGQMNVMMSATKLSIPVYIMRAFVFEDFLRTIQKHKITNLHVAPPVLVLLSKHPATLKFDTSSVEKISCGAAPLASSLQTECATRFKTTVGQGWGMTELTCSGIAVPGGETENIGGVGVLLPNCEAKLLDESGSEVPTGERGEIYIRGPNVSPGYWKNEKATRETMLEGGWLRTGDVAICNEKRWFWIVDRLKELIKVSGLQVAPAELEAILLTHPSIADAGVVGIQSSFDAQEKVRAYVALKSLPSSLPKPTAQEVEDWMGTKVAKYKWLTGGVVFVDVIPKSPSGKIQRKVLREWAKGERPKL